jgi:hypothetical protein
VAVGKTGAKLGFNMYFKGSKFQMGLAEGTHEKKGPKSIENITATDVDPTTVEMTISLNNVLRPTEKGKTYMLATTNGMTALGSSGALYTVVAISNKDPVEYVDSDALEISQNLLCKVCGQDLTLTTKLDQFQGDSSTGKTTLVCNTGAKFVQVKGTSVSLKVLVCVPKNEGKRKSTSSTGPASKKTK